MKKPIEMLRAISVDTGETRYYPTAFKEAARRFDSGNAPALMRGFPVYDPKEKTTYAVALHSTVTEAEQHLDALMPKKIVEEPQGETEEEAPPKKFFKKKT